MWAMWPVSTQEALDAVNRLQVFSSAGCCILESEQLAVETCQPSHRFLYILYVKHDEFEI